MSTEAAFPEAAAVGVGEERARAPGASDRDPTESAQGSSRSSAVRNERRQGAALAGDLEQMPLVDLLQSSANSGRSGIITLHDESNRGRLWLHGGKIHDALSEGTEHGRLEGRDAVFELLGWSQGSFVVESGDPGVEDQIGESTSFLLLEGMRHLDEAARLKAPEHAGLPEEPPEPSLEEKAVHSGLLLLNVSSSWVASALQEDLLVERLRATRDETQEGEHSSLRHFEVDDATAQISFSGDFAALDKDDVDPLITAVSAWLRAFYERVDRSLPGRFSLKRLAEMTEAHRESLIELGYGPLLAWNDEDPTP